MPGPAIPSQVLVISRWKSPWFHANPAPSCEQAESGTQCVVFLDADRIVWIGKQNEIGGSLRVSRDHVQERLLLLIGDRLGQNVGVAGYRVEYRQALITIASAADFMFE